MKGSAHSSPRKQCPTSIESLMYLCLCACLCLAASHAGASLSSSMNASTLQYLKENEHARTADRLVEDQIRIAISSKEHLAAQRARLRQASARIYQTLERFPLVNQLVQRINWRKRRDAIILALLVACCILFLILYALH